MVKTTGPLLSVNAHGQLAKTLNYSQRKEGNIGRQFHYPHKEPSQKQYTRRTILGLLTAHWQCMTGAQKLIWENNANLTDLNISGFNYFVKEAMADLKTHHGLVGYWSLNELTGATTYDYSGQGNNGTLRPDYPSNVPARTDSINKKFGKALKFDGDNDYVNIGEGNGLFDITAAITIEAWIRVISYPVTHRIIVSKVNTAYEMILLGGKIGFQADRSGSPIRASYTVTVDTNWHHVVFRFDSQNQNTLGQYHSIYLDTIIRALTWANGSDTSTPLDTNNEALQIGGRRGDITFPDGLIDEVRIYNRALSTEEIKLHYALLRRPNRRQLRLV